MKIKLIAGWSKVDASLLSLSLLEWTPIFFMDNV